MGAERRVLQTEGRFLPPFSLSLSISLSLCSTSNVVKLFTTAIRRYNGRPYRLRSLCWVFHFRNQQTRDSDAITRTFGSETRYCEVFTLSFLLERKILRVKTALGGPDKEVLSSFSFMPSNIVPDLPPPTCRVFTSCSFLPSIGKECRSKT